VSFAIIIIIAGAIATAAAVLYSQRRTRNIEGPGWSAGPKTRGNGANRDYSAGTVLEPGELPAFVVPELPGQTHYITKASAPLTGKTQIAMRYRVDMAEGASLHPVTAPGGPTIICLYFQRKGDDWMADEKCEAYRWYYQPGMMLPITAGEHELVAPMDGAWTSIMTGTAQDKPDKFAAALADTDRVGFVLGGGDGVGHGIFATGNVKITVLSFEVT
jgi:hypothetical protein